MDKMIVNEEPTLESGKLIDHRKWNELELQFWGKLNGKNRRMFSVTYTYKDPAPPVTWPLAGEYGAFSHGMEDYTYQSYDAMISHVYRGFEIDISNPVVDEWLKKFQARIEEKTKIHGVPPKREPRQGIRFSEYKPE